MQPHSGRRPVRRVRQSATLGTLSLVPQANPPEWFRAKLRDTFAFMRSQPLSFWLICTYLLLEYVRPQDWNYSPIFGMPIPSWTVILCTITFFVEGNRFRRWTLADTLLAFFSLIVVLSSMTAYLPEVAFGEWTLFFSWVLIYFLITGIVNTEQRFFVFMLLYLIFCMKMTQFGVRTWALSGFTFIKVGVSCAPAWFRNSGECGIQLSMLLPISIFFLIAVKPLWARWKHLFFLFILPFGAAIAIVATSSRGALLSSAGVALWFILKSRKRVKTLLAVGSVAAILWMIIPETSKQRLSEMGQDGDSVARLTYWEDGLAIMREYPVLGIGYKNWLPYYLRHYNAAGQHPHNIFIEAGAELGYLGLFAFVLLILGTFIMNHRTRRLADRIPDTGPFLRAMSHGFDAALIAYLIGGFFVTVLYYPFFWNNLAMTVALHCIAAKRAAAGRPRRLTSRQSTSALGAARHAA